LGYIQLEGMGHDVAPIWGAQPRDKHSNKVDIDRTGEERNLAL